MGNLPINLYLRIRQAAG